MKHGKSNVFVKGSTRFKIENLYDHTTIKDHIEAYEDSIAQRTMKKVMNNLVINQDIPIVSLMKIVYFVCKEKLAFVKYESLHSLISNIISTFPDAAQDFSKSLSYVNHTGFEKFLTAISNKIQKSLHERMRKSPWFSAIIDKSVCNSNKENLLIFIKYIDLIERKVKISYLKNIVILSTEGIGNSN